MALTWSIFLVLSGCLTPDPAAVEAQGYVASVDPLLHENGFVADVLLRTAAKTYDGTAKPEETRATWSNDIVPLTEHLRDQATLVAAPPAWVSDHENLIDIWTERADAYRHIADAVESGDPDLFQKGREQAYNAKLREETWFRDVNKRLEPYHLVVDQFP